MYRIGIDVGSTRTKYAIIDENGCIVHLFSEKTPIKQKEYFDNKVKELKNQYGNCVFYSCGYGRENVEFSHKLNELKALAKGVFEIYGKDANALDIGGQDTKLIFQKHGQLKEFFINDKCAAGCGQFLTNVLNLTEISFDSINLLNAEEPEKKLSSVCAVFAQTEIVQAIASGATENEIIIKTLWQILTQSKSLLEKTYCNNVILTGGLSQIPGIDSLAEKVLGVNVTVLEQGMYMSAIGCVIE